MPLYLAVIWAVVVLAIIAIVYLGLGGRAIFGTRERPDRILGRRCQLSSLESGPKGFDPRQRQLPPAVIERQMPAGEYVLRFETPAEWLGLVETRAYVSARHVGYPVSSVSSWRRRSVVVNGHFESGEQFIGDLRLLPKSRR